MIPRSTDETMLDLHWPTTSWLPGLAAALVACIGLAAPSTTRAQSPQKLPIQGNLAKKEGQTPAAPNLTFTLYDGEEGDANELFSQTIDDVPLDDGRFSVMLDTTDSSSNFTEIFTNNQNVWLEVKVNDNDPLPRMQLGSVPYASNAGHASTAETANDASQLDGQDPSAYSYSGGNGIEIDGDNHVSMKSCSSADQVLKWDGSTWTCQEDRYAEPLSTPSGCNRGQKLYWDANNASWGCRRDRRGISKTCSTDEILVYNSGWTCSNLSTLVSSDFTSTSSGLALATDSVDSDEIMSSAVDTDEINAGAVGSNEMAANSVTGTEVDPTATLTAENYEYNNAKVSYLPLFPSDFRVVAGPRPDNWIYDHSGGNGGAYGYFDPNLTGSSTTVDLKATVKLPEDSRMTNMTCYYYDNDSSANISRLYLSPAWRNYNDLSLYSSAPADEIDISSSGASDTVQTAQMNLSALVDNERDRYYVSGWFEVSAASSNVRFYGCRIKYEQSMIMP